MAKAVSGKEIQKRKNMELKDPFNTLAKRYRPKNIKDAFSKSEDVYENNILILRSIYKLAEYPITRLKFDVKLEEEDSNIELEGMQKKDFEEIYRHIFEDVIGINQRLVEIGLDYFLYSNVFPFLSLPFERRFTCQNCKNDPTNVSKKKPTVDTGSMEPQSIDSEQITDLKWDGKTFTGTCPICDKKDAKFDVIETPERNNYDDVCLSRRNPHNIEIEESELTGKKRYTYKLSSELTSKIKKNNRFTLDNTPIIALKAAYSDKTIELAPSNIFHFKMPSPSRKKSIPWAWPMLVSAFWTIFFIQHLRLAAESIAEQHIDPEPYVCPAEALDRLLAKHDMAEIRNQLQNAYKQMHDKEMGAFISPIPISTGILNLQGKIFLPDAEIRQAMADLFIGIGLPRGVLSGEGPYRNNSVNIRVLENGFLTYREYINELLTYLARKMQGHFNLPECEISMTEFVKLDDSLYKQQMMQAASAKQISNEAYIKTLGLNPETEAEKIREETLEQAKLQAEAEAELAKAQAAAFEDQEVDRMASMVEADMNAMEQRMDATLNAIQKLIDKGYDRQWAMQYILTYRQEQAFMAEQQAAQARAMEAERAFMLDRMANAATGLNRAQNAQQMHQAMDAAMTDPAMQYMQQEQGAVGDIVRRAMMMPDHERKLFLDEMQRRQPTLWQMVTNALGTYPGGIPPGAEDEA